MNDNPFYEPYWDTELEHHGVKNMKWGVKNGPPYPVDRGKDGRVTKIQKKKKQGLIARMRKEHAKKKAQAAKAKQKKQAQNEQKKEQLTEKQKAELREKLLKSSDPNFIAKHLDLLSTSEIDERIKRINTETNLKKLVSDPKEKKKTKNGQDTIKSLGAMATEISKIADAAQKSANAYSAIYDAANKKQKDKEAKREAAEKNKIAEETRERTRQQQDEDRARKQREEDRISLERRSISNQVLRNLKDYREMKDTYDNVQINFDPTTGKLTFDLKDTKKKKN